MAATTSLVLTAQPAAAQGSPWENEPMGYTAFGLTPGTDAHGRVRVGIVSPSGEQTIFGTFPADSTVVDLSGDARTLMVQVPERGGRTQFSIYDTVVRANVGHVRVTGDVRGARLSRGGSEVYVNTSTAPVWVKYHRTGGGATLMKGISSQSEMAESLDGGYVFGINAQNKLQQTDSHTGATVKAVALLSGFTACNPGRALDNDRIAVNCADDRGQHATVFADDHSTGTFANLSGSVATSANGYAGAWQTERGLLVGQNNGDCAPTPGWVKGSSWTKVNGATEQVAIDTVFADGSEAVGVSGGCGDARKELVAVSTVQDGDFTPMVGGHTNVGWELISFAVQDAQQ